LVGFLFIHIFKGEVIEVFGFKKVGSIFIPEIIDGYFGGIAQEVNLPYFNTVYL